jgi:Chaperone of endosialidase
MRNSIRSIITTLAFICFNLLPQVQAVNPPPDGGYPGGNTAEGQNALLGLASGTYNTAVGFLSLETLTTGQFNTAIGAGTLLSNTADQNTATGAGALLNNTTGDSNTATGVFALFDNTTGGSNTANGFAALGNNTTGSSNTANGANTLLNNTTGQNNTATGVQALQNNTTGANNTASGVNALISNTTGLGNTAMGFQASQNTTTGDGNTAIGTNALQSDTIGGSNTAIGSGALLFNITGDSNTALGVSAGNGVTTGTNVICIGAGIAGANVNNSCFIGNIRDVQTHNADAIPVVIDSDGQLGTASSSRRFKKEIKPMNNASESILGLEPVTFYYKSDKTDTPQFGLIAEEVAKVNPDLVVRDENGEIYTVRYDAVNAMLLNEFLKEHHEVEQLEATVASLVATVKDQAVQLQKVSAEVGINKPAAKVVSMTP